MAEETAAPAAVPEGAGGEDTIARAGALAFVAKLIGGAFTAALTIFLARQLGPAEYGLLALALSVVALVELPSDFGVAVALPRFIAEHRSEPAVLRALLADALRLETMSSFAVAALLALLAGTIARAYDAPGLAAPLRILALALIGQNFLFLLSGVFTAMRRQGPALLATTFESFGELSASIALVLLAGGVSAAAAGRAIGYGVGASCALVLAVRLLGTGALPRSIRPAGHVRRILDYAGPLWIVDSVYTGFMQVDALLIGAYLSAGSVAFFSAPMKLTAALAYPGYAIASAVSPRLMRDHVHPVGASELERSVRLLSVIMVPVAVLTTVWATPIIHLILGSGYGKSAEVLRALGPFVLLCGTAVLSSTALNYLGGARRRIPIAIATLLVNVLIDVILIPRIGILGAAAGTDAGYGVYVLAQLSLCLRLLGAPLRGQLTTLARCLLAAAPMTGALFLLGTGPHGVGVLLAGGAGSLLLYAVALALSGEVSGAELRALRTALRSGPRRPRS
jgi:O-antigen/teichoic acid export membrane protein